MSNVLLAPSLGKITFDSLTAGVATQSALTASAQITYDGLGGINIASYNTAGTERLTVDGVNGRLFTVSDVASGSIFSVNDISGLPIIDVNSGATDVIKIGTYGLNTLVVNDNKVGIGTATPSLALQVVGSQTTSGTGIFGIAKIGESTSHSAMARFGHSTRDNSTDYGFLQDSIGTVYISSSSATSVRLRVNNVDSAKINASGTASTTTTSGTLIVTGGLGVSGAIYSSTAIAQTTSGTNVTTSKQVGSSYVHSTAACFAAVTDNPTTGAANVAFTALRTGDTVSRLSVTMDGVIQWGSGAATLDTTLARTGASQLTLTGALIVSSALNTSAGRTKNISVKTANYTLVSTDHIIVANNSSSFTLTLPAASSNTGREYIIKNKGAGVVTVDATALGQLDGVNTTTVEQYSALTVISDGTTWNIF